MESIIALYSASDFSEVEYWNWSRASARPCVSPSVLTIDSCGPKILWAKKKKLGHILGKNSVKKFSEKLSHIMSKHKFGH